MRSWLLRAALAAAGALACTTLAVANDSPLIYGIHDADGASALPTGGFVVQPTTLLAGSDPLGGLRTLTSRGLTVIVRVNHGYGSDGTIPAVGPGEAYGSYQEWAQKIADMARSSPHITHWIIGNEVNLPGEWPTRRSNGQRVPLTVDEYFACYSACYDAIKAARPDALVIPSPIAPYAGDQGTGDDSMRYFTKLMAKCANRCDAVAIHAYTHGQDPALASDDTPMQTLPMHLNFRVYRDFLGALPASLRSKPAYITECDPGPFRDVNNGWVRAIYHEIQAWNATPGTQKVRCVALYRWAPFDQDYSVGNRPQVQADLALAVAENISWRSSALPDLAVTDLGFTPAAPSPNDSVRFYSVITNKGTTATPANTALGVAYLIDGHYQTWGSQTRSLAPGESVRIETDGPPWVAPAGTHVLTAVADDVNRIDESDEKNQSLARSIDVVAGGDPDAGGTFFAQTGHAIGKRFEAYWNKYGGLAQFGYPITDVRDEVSKTDGKKYRVQYFERARLELHPENAPPYDVLLGLLGAERHGRDPATADDHSGHYFSETGHNVGARFYEYWQQHGGLFVNGYPVSEEIDERCEDGVVRRVQYFERCRYEHHPENAPPYDVLLGRLGALLVP